jgi:mitochondrial fission protein ELM1
MTPLPAPDDLAGADRPDATRSRPLIWLVLSDKLGDNAQVRTIADALPWPCVEKRLLVQPQFATAKPPVVPSLHHLDRDRSDPLEPPWPDLVITIGRRMSMAALWIQEQSRGRTKLAIIGQPRRLRHRFQLVVAATQYRVPDRPNILRLDYPPMRIDEPAIAAAAALWRPRLAALPRPLVALLVGGRTSTLRLDAAVGRRLIARSARLAAAAGGTLYVTTSRRTPAEAVDAIAAALPEGAVLHRWTADQAANPYLALLGLADRFIVTGDSLSMLVEVARLGRPLAIYPLPTAGGPVARAGRWLADRLHRLGLPIGSREVAVLHRLLIRQGFAVWFGQPFRPAGPRAPDELGRIVGRIIALVESPPARVNQRSAPPAAVDLPGNGG